jgi:hypothetical protein
MAWVEFIRLILGDARRPPVGLALRKIILLTTEAFSIKTQVPKLLILRVGAQEFESRATIAFLDV